MSTALIEPRAPPAPTSAPSIPPSGPAFLAAQVQDRLFWFHGFKLNKKGGLVFEDKDVLKNQQGVVKDVMVQLGTQLLSGKLAVRLSLPIRLFEARSLLERVAEAWSYAPTFLAKAATTTDAVERMKNVMCFVVGGLHCCVNQHKPFNPILGETHQSSLPDGTMIYMEHIQHHPPVSAFAVYGPNDLYTLFGKYEFESAMSGNTITNFQNGVTMLQCANGAKLKYELPQIKMGGVMLGDRLIEWTGIARFADAQSNLAGTLDFDANDGFLGRSSSDDIKGSIHELKKGTKAPIKVTGSWLSQLSFDGKVAWDIAAEPVFLSTPVETALPSDTRYRDDLVDLKKGAVDQAQASKLRLEELQRHDKKIRCDVKSPSPTKEKSRRPSFQFKSPLKPSSPSSAK